MRTGSRVASETQKFEIGNARGLLAFRTMMMMNWILMVIYGDDYDDDSRSGEND